jgi:Protein of unknown function (DUF3574)
LSRAFASGITLVLLAGCAANAPPPAQPTITCAAGDTVLVRETLYFGRNRPDGGTVSDAEWKTFLAQVVTPRFPHGLTVLNATGQWKSASGEVEEERSEVVTIFHPDDETGRRSVREIALEYKRRFRQEAVLRERAPTCASFE